MGAHFWLPVDRGTWSEIHARLKHVRLWVAEATEGTPYTDVDWRGDVALVVGGEAKGASTEARRGASYVHIPMAPGVESLNAAVAAAVLLFEAARVRRTSGPLPLD